MTTFVPQPDANIKKRSSPGSQALHGAAALVLAIFMLPILVCGVLPAVASVLTMVTSALGMIPGMMVLALVFYAIIRLRTAQNRKHDQWKKARSAVSTEAQALVMYIITARQAAMLDEQIRTELRSKGWAEEKINGAFVLA